MKDIFIVYPDKLGTISPEIYGHFSEHIGGVFYDGLWVGKDSEIDNVRGFRKELVEKFRAVEPPVVRWPGGCFAETYNWRDGIGAQRPVRRNWWMEQDSRTEPNSVGTHEFMDFCEMTGAAPYVAANITSMTPMDIRGWMDYCLSPRGSTALAVEREKNGRPEPWKVPYWGVGNENWGGGGDMTAAHYADEFRRYAVVMNNTAPNVSLFACGQNGEDYAWTREFFRNFGGSQHHVNGYSVHYYCGHAGDPLEFTDGEWTQLLEKAQKMEDIIVRTWGIICGYKLREDPKLVIDEWGCWHLSGSGPSHGANLFEQQSTMRDAMVTALTLNIFNRHCDKIRMANVAQLVNNLHCLFLAGGKKFTVTPAYHVFNMYKGHQGAEAVRTAVTENDDFPSSLSVSASVKNGRTLLTVGNLSPTSDAEFMLRPVGGIIPGTARAALLSGPDLHAHNDFEHPAAVSPSYSDVSTQEPLHIPRGSVMALNF